MHDATKHTFDTMDSTSLSSQSLPLLQEGVSLVFARWTALQMAILQGWGGRNSSLKSDKLCSDLVSWLAQSKEYPCVYDLEDLIDDAMVELFNAEIEDGSIEEVAAKVMNIYDGCLENSYESVYKLRANNTGTHGVSQSRQVGNEEADDSSDEDVDNDMHLDEQQQQPVLQVSDSRPEMQVDAPALEDGWSVVASRRNRGRRFT